MKFINSPDMCSRGLREILELEGIAKNEIFELPIAESPILNIVKKLAPKEPCTFHIGCPEDNNRMPNIVRIRRGRVRSAKYLEFCFKRTIPPDIVLANGWFVGNQGKRNLEKTAAALNDWRQCEETITFVCRTSPGDLGLTLEVNLFFREGKLQKIWAITDMQSEPFAGKLVGFKGSPLASLADKVAAEMERLNNLNSDDWNKILAEEDFTIESLIKQFYALFKKSSKHLHKTEI